MKRFLLTFLLTTALHGQQPAAAPHTFTSTDGRKLTATIVEKTATSVTIRRAEDGKDFILPLDRLSAADQAFVKVWGTKPVPLVMADPALPESWVVQPKYVFAWEFARLPGTSGPIYTTFEPRRTGPFESWLTGLIRSDGMVICDPDKDESVPHFFFNKDGVQQSQVLATYFRDHRVLPKLSGGKWGLVDLDGRQVVPPQWDWVGSFSEGLFNFTVAGKRGYANLKGEVVIPPQWYFVHPFSGGYAIVQAAKGGKRSVIDKTGKIISDAVWDDVKGLRVFQGVRPPDHVSVFDFRPAELPPGVFWVSQNKKWGLYDIGRNVPMGEVQWGGGVGSAHDFINGRAWVLRDGKYGQIDLTGKVVLEPTWEGVKSRDGFYGPPVRVGNCIQADWHGKTPCWHLDGTPALTDDVYGDSVQKYRGYFQLKIESGKVIRVEKNFRVQEPTRMVLRRGGNKNAVGEMVGLADLDGKLLGKVTASWINATPSSDYFMLTFHDSRCGLIDAAGKEVEPVAEVDSLPLDTLEISDAKSLPDGEIVAAFKGIAKAGTSDALFIQTKNGLTKVPWKAPAAALEGELVQEAPDTVTVKPHQKDGKWGYIRLIEAK
jgi:hypothetical protein